MARLGRSRTFEVSLRREIESLKGSAVIARAAADDRLRVGEAVLELGPLRSHWAGLRRSARVPWLRDTLPTLLARPELPDQLDTTRLLRPGLRPRAVTEAARLRNLADGVRNMPSPRARIPHRVVAGDIVAVLLWEHHTNTVVIDEYRLERWGARFSDLIDVASDNLADAASVRWSSEDGRLWEASTRDRAGSGRLLNPGFFSETNLTGELVALFADRETTLVTSVADAASIEALCHRGIEIADRSIPVSLRPLVGRPNRWRHLRLPSSHPAADPLRRLSLLDFESNYTILNPVLEELLGRDLTMGPFEIRKDEDGSWHSATAWAESTAALLPRTDLIDLISDGGSAVTLSWAEFHRRAGPHMERTGHYPELWRVEGFSTAAKHRGPNGH